VSVVTSEDLLAYIKAMPGATAEDAAKFFGSTRKQMGSKLSILLSYGCVRFEKVNRVTLYKWFSTGEGLNKRRGGHRSWPDEKKDKLRAMYQTAPWGEILIEMHPSERRAIEEMAKTLGLKRNRNIGRANGKESIHKMREALLAKTHAKHMEEDQQRIVVVPAKAADENVVVRALTRRTPLEQAWSGQ
jgi:hypothetical protein